MTPVKCEKCGREYDLDMEPSGLGENDVLCSRCIKVTEKYCIHGFWHTQGKTEVLAVRKRDKLTNCGITLKLDVEGKPTQEIFVPVKFHKLAQYNVWTAVAKNMPNIWAKAHLTTEECPPGWKGD